MALTLFLFFFSAIVIYLSCEYFVNGIEWCGYHLKLGATAVGSVLAAFGTALPESIVTFIAVVFGETPEQKDIGVGAAMGGPLVLATLAYGIIGLAVVFNFYRARRDTLQIKADYKRLSHDQLAFLAIFIFKVMLGLFIFSYKPYLGVLFLLAYAIYVYREIRYSDTATEEESLDPLKFSPKKTEPLLIIAIIQTLVAIVVIGFASHIFVAQIEQIGIALNWQPHFVALLLSPVATELPEILNAVIWIRQGKERLALANVSGAMMIQATIPSALGIFFTPWFFDKPLIISGVITTLSIIVLWFVFRHGNVDARRLSLISLLYGAFIASILFWI